MGGCRCGAGRRKGVPPRVPSKRYLLEQANSRTRAILRKYPPLDVMLFTTNAFVVAADILGSRILEINEQIITRLSLLERAARIAKEAAPMCILDWCGWRCAEDGKQAVVRSSSQAVTGHGGLDI